MTRRRRLLIIALVATLAAAAWTLTSHLVAYGTLFLGDSITLGWDVSGVIANSENGGHYGATSAELVQDFALRYGGQRWRRVIVLMGVNDLWRGVSDDALRGNVDALLARLNETDTPVFVGALLPVGPEYRWISGRVVATNAWLRSRATALRAVYVDYYSAMVGPDGLARAGLLVDGLHPTAAGYAVMRSVLLNARLPAAD